MKTTGPRITPLEIKTDLKTNTTEAPAKVKGTTTVNASNTIQAPAKTNETAKTGIIIGKSLPPTGAALFQASDLDVTKAEIEKLAKECTDPATKAALLQAAKAASSVAKMASVSTPMRLTLKEDKSRPQEIEGYLDRSMTGTSGDPKPRVQFTPKDRKIHSFPIDPVAIEGLRNGARISLVLENTGDGKQTYAVKADDSAYAGSFAATVVKDKDGIFAVGLPSAPVYSKIPLQIPLIGAEKLVGKAVVVDVENPSIASERSGTVRQVLGEAGGLHERLMEAALREGADVGFSTAAMAEVKALLDNPPMTGKDLTHLQFITIDNVGSKDLDQAMAIERRADGGYDVHYAIADVAHFIPPGSALDIEAKRRTQTAYLVDGHNIPMLPKELSEGLISLLPNQKRRAFVVTVSCDANGDVTNRSFQRGIVESKKQLAYTQVQAFEDGGMKGDLAGHAWSDNLTLLKELGAKRVKMAEDRGVVPSDGGVPELGVKDDQITIHSRGRNEVEKWNEQISLLANEAVGRELRTSGVKALFRTHDTPPPEKVEAFRELVAALGVPWPENQLLSDFIRELDPKDSRTAIISGHSTRVNVPASYQTQWAGGHSGLKLEDYAHFTAPMRRYTDVIDARILAALVEGTPVPYQGPGDYTLDQVQKLAEDVKRRDNNLEQRQKNILLTAFFGTQLGKQFEGTVVGVRPSGVQVSLAGSGLNVSLPVSVLGTGLAALENAATVIAVGDNRYKLGSGMKVELKSVDINSDRVLFAPS